MMRFVAAILAVVLSTIAGGAPLSAQGVRAASIPAPLANNLHGGPTLDYLRLVGGSRSEATPHMAVGGSGNIFLAGQTASPNWPVPWPPHCGDPSTATCAHGFLLKMSPDAKHVYYSVLLAGSWAESVAGVAVDRAGNAYLTGQTSSPDFPTVRPLQRHCAWPRGGCLDGFVVKLDPRGKVMYSTYLGGAGEDRPTAIAVDRWGDAYVTGVTNSADFPTVRAIQRHLRGHSDGFVAKIDPTGRHLLYSTYLGGSHDDGASGIAVDRLGQAYIAGTTTSVDFRTSSRSLQPKIPGGKCGFYPCEVGFLVKLGTAGRFLAGTFSGFAQWNVANAVALDPSGNAYIVGSITSAVASGSTTLVGPGDKKLCGANGDMAPCNSAYISELSPWLDHLVYSLVLSGDAEDIAGAVAVDGRGRALIGGTTRSTDFPTVNPVQAKNGGGECPFGKGDNSPCDGFVAAIAPRGRAVKFSTYLGGDGEDAIASVALDGHGSAVISGFTSSMTLAPGVSRPPSTGFKIFVGRINGVFAG